MITEIITMRKLHEKYLYLMHEKYVNVIGINNLHII